MTKVAISGASGLVGTGLSAHLRARGDEVVHLVRREPRTAAEVGWDPASGRLDPAAFADVDVVVNLSGAGVGDHRWTPSYRRTLISSRVDSTSTIVRAVVESGGPRRLVNGSAVGYYGPRGEEVVTEETGPGEDFLADVVRAWEGATQPAVDAGIPVALARTGTIVLSAEGGALGRRILPLARLGLFGPMGSGRQFWSLVTLHDEVRALTHLIDREDLTGPVNISGDAVRQRDFARALGRGLHRPAVLPAPSPAMHAVLGQFAEAVLGSQRVRSERLLADGFTFRHADVDAMVGYVLGGA